MSPEKFRIAVFASGSGTNAEAVIRYFSNHPTIRVSLLLTNNGQAYALQRAKNHRITNYHFTRQEFNEGSVVKSYLQKGGAITHIVLAGFLWLIPDYLIQLYPGKIINIHPALLPKYGGKGMYGLKVHQAVKAAGDTETGITIHLVNDRYDDGKILFQATCTIKETDTAEEVDACVRKLEHEHYPQIIERWITGGIV